MTMHSILFARFRLKALSLLFAAVLWLFVMLETGDEHEFAVKLKPVNTASGFTVAINPPELKARLGGVRALLLRQQLIGLTVEIDLSQRDAGALTLKSSDSHLQVVPGLKLLALSPGSLEIIISQQK
ncbi:MAG: hypothetical protein FIA91_03925 [Geobacter sp.]|nr:hypothetical protein [Geobacter sp.]